ncbi:C40 family peptidase [Chryseobacterium sp. A301]
MRKAICMESVAAIREEDSIGVAMVSQALYGETMTVLETRKQSAKIEMDYDGVQGWIDLTQIAMLDSEDLLESSSRCLSKRFAQLKKGDSTLVLSLGSEIESNDPEDLDSNRSSIENLLMEMVGAPFLEGGRSSFGLDGSAFVQLIFKAMGLRLPRYAKDQAERGEVLSFVGEAQAGDVAFFENAEGQIVHAGIMTENQKIIHVYGHVRMDCLDSSGIFNSELNMHSHKLRFIKRILD